MSEQTIQKQIAREYYNVIYGAKMNFASLDICEKFPNVISFLSLAFGILGLSFQTFNNKTLASVLLIFGILGIMLKPKEMVKKDFNEAGKKLTDISKRLEILHSEVVPGDADKEHELREKLKLIQVEHGQIDQPSPVFMASWYAHYKLFSEHNNTWFCKELNLKWTDKIPLSLRFTFFVLLIIIVILIDPFCFISQFWHWVELPCAL